jgi:hypothetical protein
VLSSWCTSTDPEIAGVIHPCPTQAEAIKGAAMNWRKTRLTPTIAKLLKG